MHISHCSTLKITPITDLCLQQSDKKKSALMHLQPGLARILAARRNKTMRGEGKRNKEGACFIFHLQLFCCCFLEGRRGEGRRVRMELYVEVESAAASSLQQPSTSRGEKNRTQGHMLIARTCDWPSALYVLQKTSFLYFLPSCSYCSTPLFVIPPAVLILLFALFILLSSPSFSPHLLTSCPLSLTSLVCFISLASFSSPIS